MKALLRCSAATLQPMELFPLFPQHTAPWSHLLPKKHYWHLHRPLPDLYTLVRTRLQVTAQAAASNGHLQQVEGFVAEATASIAEYLLQVFPRHLSSFQQ